MLQFYALSVLLNVLVGLVLLYAKNYSKEAIDNEDGSLSDDEPSEEKSGSDAGFLDNQTFRLVLGIVSLFVGLLKILSPVAVAVIGDIIPALAGIVGGLVLLFEYYISSSSLETSLPEIFTTVAVHGRRYVGIACIVAGLLHFICPGVPLL